MKILMVGNPNMKNTNLLKILTNKLKYTTPEVEIINFDNMPDIITTSSADSSMQMAKLSPEELVEESNKKRKEKESKEPPMLTENDRVVLGTGNVVNVYPNGLPKNVLEVINYSKFGAMLKQEQLLPPSYDRKPVKVSVDTTFGIPVVRLIFKSKTSESYRTIGISRYYVSCSKNGDTTHEINPLMIPLWRRFAESVMWKWENGYRFEILDKQRKGEIGKSLMQEDMEYIEHLKRMGDEYIKVIEEQHKNT